MADRKHRPTGQKPPGGPRPGAGRKPGGFNPLPQGTVRAIHAARLRLPEGVHPAAEALAQKALGRLEDVLDDRVDPFMVTGLLKAVAMAREEVCGPLPTKTEVTGKDGERFVININTRPRGGG